MRALGAAGATVVGERSPLNDTTVAKLPCEDSGLDEFAGGDRVAQPRAGEARGATRVKFCHVRLTQPCAKIRGEFVAVLWTLCSPWQPARTAERTIGVLRAFPICSNQTVGA